MMYQAINTFPFSPDALYTRHLFHKTYKLYIASLFAGAFADTLTAGDCALFKYFFLQNVWDFYSW